eukprot:3401526-Prymnesium_polylepis.1
MLGRHYAVATPPSTLWRFHTNRLLPSVQAKIIGGGSLLAKRPQRLVKVVPYRTHASSCPSHHAAEHR